MGVGWRKTNVITTLAIWLPDLNIKYNFEYPGS